MATIKKITAVRLQKSKIGKSTLQRSNKFNKLKLGLIAAGLGLIGVVVVVASHASGAVCSGPCLSIAGASTQGYWVTAQDGGVFSYGAPFYGSVPGAGVHITNAVSIISTSTNKGYWIIARDGGVFAFGDAPFKGSLPGNYPNSPVGNIVGAARTTDNQGYWLVGSDGGVFAFGNAAFKGSMGGQHLNAPVVSIAASPDGAGYWLVGRDGGVFAYGAPFYGAATGKTSAANTIVANPKGGGYWIASDDGGIFSYGNAPFYGSMGGKALAAPMKSMAATPTGAGYWMLGADGGIFAYGDAVYVGRPTTPTPTPVPVPAGYSPCNAAVASAVGTESATFNGILYCRPKPVPVVSPEFKLTQGAKTATGTIYSWNSYPGASKYQLCASRGQMGGCNAPTASTSDIYQGSFCTAVVVSVDALDPRGSSLKTASISYPGGCGAAEPVPISTPAPVVATKDTNCYGVDTTKYPIIKQGMTSNCVSVARTYFNQVTNHSLPITPVFDSAFALQVVLWQKQHSLAADGVIGSQTWSALYRDYQNVLAASVRDAPSGSIRCHCI